jgi:hypothetical protein
MTDPNNARPEDPDTSVPMRDKTESSEPPEDQSPFELHLLDKLEEAELEGWDDD